MTHVAPVELEIDGKLGLFGGWRKDLDERLADIAEEQEASIIERDRLSSTPPPLP